MTLGYKQTEWEADMKRSGYALLLGAVSIAAISAWTWHEVAIDQCLDNGGRWNYQRSIFEMQR